MNHAGTLTKRQAVLAETNVGWLRQAERLLRGISDSAYTDSPAGLAPHRVGGHMRHILEFYECFLEGIAGGHIDYDARKRDMSLETMRTAALTKIRAIIDALESRPELQGDAVIWVRMEDCEAREVPVPFLTSSIGRELQVLSSHTIHHFALIAVTLRWLGYGVDRDFGMAPSTLRYESSQRQPSVARAEAA